MSVYPFQIITREYTNRQHEGKNNRRPRSFFVEVGLDCAKRNGVVSDPDYHFWVAGNEITAVFRAYAEGDGMYMRMLR